MKLFFRTYGNGPLLIILHGLYGSSDNWVTVARKLSAAFTVILPDLRNHGQSPHSPEHTYESMVSDIHELAAGLSTERFFLAGHSMGGKAAMLFALRHPAMLNGLAVLDISPFGSTDPSGKFYLRHRHIIESILSTSLTGVKSRVEADRLLAEKIDSEKIRGFLMKNLSRDAEGYLVWKINAPALLSSLAHITGSIADKEEHPYITGFPVIFLRGEESDYLEPGEIRDIRKLFPAAGMVTIPGAGHWLHADNPSAVETALLGFLDQ